MSIVPLPWEHGGHPRAPDVLDCREDSDLVVDQHIVITRIPPLDIVEFLLFMNIDQHMAIHSLEKTGPFDFSWLEHHVPIRQDDRLSPLFHLFHRIERIRKQSIRKWIVHQKMRDRQYLWIAWMLDPKALERPQVVGVAEFRSQPLEDRPVVFLPFVPHRLFKMALKIGRHPIVVEEGVVDIEEKHDVCRSNQPFPHLLPDGVGKHVSMEVRKGHPILLMTRQTRKELGQAIGNEFDSYGRQYQSQQPSDDVNARCA
jgi:hypothetical protein